MLTLLAYIQVLYVKVNLVCSTGIYLLAVDDDDDDDAGRMKGEMK